MDLDFVNNNTHFDFSEWTQRSTSKIPEAMKNLYLSIIAMIALVVGVNSPLEAQQKEVKKAIPIAGASLLHSEIEFPVGNLRIKPTSGHTTKCIFQFRKDEWEPEVHYNKEGDEGYLKITSEGGVNFDFDDDRHSGYEK